jgi:hypothetical protein
VVHDVKSKEDVQPRAPEEPAAAVAPAVPWVEPEQAGGPLALPWPQEKIAAYAARLRSLGTHVSTSTGKNDDPGHPEESETLILPTRDFFKAYLIAQKLFGIPAALRLPEKGLVPEAVIELPEKEGGPWETSLTVARNEDGSIKSLAYFLRGEGGGEGARITAKGARSIEIFHWVFGD